MSNVSQKLQHIFLTKGYYYRQKVEVLKV